jgi:T-complex protein 1 subunit alpha
MSYGRDQTIILRNAHEFFLEKIEQSMHESLCVIKRVLESNSVVAGDGLVESFISLLK